MNKLINERLDVSVDISSSTSALIRWNGDPAVEYYFYYWEFPTGMEIGRKVRGIESSIAGLITGRRYTVRITGGGRQGGTTFVPYEIPETPEKPRKIRYVGVNFNYETYPQDVIYVRWSPVGGKGTGYRLTYYPLINPDDKCTFTLVENEHTATGLSLEGEGKYVFSVAAVYPDGDSEPTQVLTSTQIDNRPDQLGNFRTLDRGPTFITISWSPTVRALRYEISHDKMDRPNIQEATTARFDNLEPGIRYEFRVAPLSASGVMGGGSYWAEYTSS